MKHPAPLPSSSTMDSDTSAINFNLNSIEPISGQRGNGLFDMLFNSPLYGIALTDMQGNFLQCNQLFMNMTGYSMSELKGKTNWDITPKKWVDGERTLVREQLKSRGYTDLIEKEFICKDGRILPVELVVLANKNEKGESVSAWGFVRDISYRQQRKQEMERQLQEITLLHDITNAGTQAKNLDDFIERTTQLLADTLFTDNFGIMLVDDNGKSMKPHPSYRGITKDAINETLSLENGITGRAVRTGNPQRVEDVKIDPDYIEFFSDTRSELAVPIIVRDHVFGVINTEKNLPSAFTELDESLLVTFARQLAVVIEKMDFFMASQRQAEEIRSLYEASLAISGIVQPEKMLRTLHKHIRELIEIDVMALALYNQEDGQVDVYTGSDDPVSGFNQNQQVTNLNESGLIGWVITHGKPALFDDLTYQRPPAGPAPIDNPQGAWIGVPLISRGGVFGALTTRSYHPRRYDKNHLRLMESVAAQVSIALDNARLIQRTQNQLERLSALHDIDLAINSTMDLRVILNILLDQVVQNLKVDAATVLLLDEESQTLEYAAGRGFRTRSIEGYRLRLNKGTNGKTAIEHHIVQAFNLAELEEQLEYLSLMRDEGFLSYYSAPLVAKGEIKGILEIFNRTLLTPDQEWLDFLETLSGQAAIAIDNIKLLDSLQRSNIETTQAYEATLKGWSRALEFRDKETEGHTERVAELTVKISRQLGLPDEDIINIYRGALMHDIGKMGIPDRILLKNGPLTVEEMEAMHRHPDLAYELLSPFEYLKPALDIPYCHHEKWDGSGYPRGLKMQEIPLSARIFSIVDVWDALTSDRPYRKAMDLKKALDYIESQKNKHFDPDVTEAFLHMIRNEIMAKL